MIRIALDVYVPEEVHNQASTWGVWCRRLPDSQQTSQMAELWEFCGTEGSVRRMLQDSWGLTRKEAEAEIQAFGHPCELTTSSTPSTV